MITSSGIHTYVAAATVSPRAFIHVCMSRGYPLDLRNGKTNKCHFQMDEHLFDEFFFFTGPRDMMSKLKNILWERVSFA